jgi:hypothetical protein
VTTADEIVTGSRRDKRSLKFLRDVGINVLANLIAASVIYIGGALARLFPRNEKLLSCAALVLLGATFFGLAALISRLEWLWGAAVIVGSGTMLVIAFTTVDDIAWSVYFSVIAASWMIMGVWLIRLSRKEADQPSP